MTKIQVLGICRFSLLVEKGFQAMGPQDLDARREKLYDPQRLAQRFVWFEHVFLPALRDQTDPDFRMVILTGEDFPRDALARLKALIAPLPQMVLDQRPAGSHRAMMRDVIRDHIDPSADVVAQFRLDDDDAVGVTYVERIRSDFLLTDKIYAEAGMMAINYPKGFVLHHEGQSVRGEPWMSHYWGCGLTLYFPPDHDKCVFDYTHFLVPGRMHSVSFANPPMYVRGWHGGNDSAELGANRGHQLAEHRVPVSLRHNFSIDLEAFAKALAALANS
ncbi:MAG: glycosyltransferase [Pseudorhodobacter sp.]